MNVLEIKKKLASGELILDGNKLYTKSEYEQIQLAEQQAEHYDLLQLTKKIQLNSAYGSLLNVAFRFGRREVGASVTGCGRQITHFMNETIGSLVSGEECIVEKRYAPSKMQTVVTDDGQTRTIYKTVMSSDDLAIYRKQQKWSELEKFPARAGEIMMYKGVAHPCYGAFYYSKNTHCIYSDTDSVDSSSIVYATINNARYKTTIEDLFLKISLKTQQNEKEYAHSSINQQIYSPCLTNNGIVDKPVLAIYRHKVKKAKWQITLQSGKKVIVTGDHSIMIVRNGEMLEIKAKDINRDTDFCISIKEKQC